MKNELNTIICENILRIRTIRGFTQSYISDIIGVKQPSYNRLEAGMTNVSTHHLYSLATFYEVFIDDFYVRDSMFDKDAVMKETERISDELKKKLDILDSVNKNLQKRNEELERRNTELEEKVDRKDKKIESLMHFNGKSPKVRVKSLL